MYVYLILILIYRVRELFESRDTGEAKLSFNYMLKEKRIRKRMKVRRSNYIYIIPYYNTAPG